MPLWFFLISVCHSVFISVKLNIVKLVLISPPFGEKGQHNDTCARGQRDLDLGIEDEFFDFTHSHNLSDH